MSEQRYPDELVGLVADAIFRYDIAAEPPLVTLPGPGAEHRGEARAALDALAAAGRLIPDGSQVETEYGAMWRDDVDWMADSPEEARLVAANYQAITGQAHAVYRRTVITTLAEVVE